MSVSFRAFQRRREIQPLADRAPRESATAGMSDHDTSKMNPGSDMVAEPVQPAKPSSTRLKGFVAGWVSGVTKLTVGHPLDTVKIRRQVSTAYSSSLDAFVQTVKHQGIRGLYAGATPPLVGWSISDPILLGSLNIYRLQFASMEARSYGREPDGIKGLSLPGHMLAGMMAGCTASTVNTPVELLKSKLQMQLHNTKRLYTGPIDCAKQVVQSQGIGGLWHALPANLAFRANFAFMFGSYEVFMRVCRQQGLPEGTANFVSGGLGSIFFWLPALPFDAIKNTLMSDSITAPRYRGWMDCAQQIWREGGIRHFYRGLGPCVIRALPTNASALFMFETTMRFLGGA